jgi:hypothetical protein
MNYLESQAKRDAEYAAAFPAWFESLPPEQREVLRAAGIDQPDFKRTSRVSGADLLALERTPAAQLTPAESAEKIEAGATGCEVEAADSAKSTGIARTGLTAESLRDGARWVLDVPGLTFQNRAVAFFYAVFGIEVFPACSSLPEIGRAHRINARTLRRHREELKARGLWRQSSGEVCPLNPGLFPSQKPKRKAI